MEAQTTDHDAGAPAELGLAGASAASEPATEPVPPEPVPPELAHKLYARLCASLSLRKAATRGVCDKAQLARCELRSTPETFVLDGSEHDERAAFWVAFERAQDAEGPEQLWLTKPADGRCGAGIQLFRDEAAARLATAPPEQGARQQRRYKTVPPVVVVQRYLMDPLLVNGVKFDIRAHVVVITGSASVAPRALLHVHSSYARFASGRYETARLDIARHLTNISLREDDTAADARVAGGGTTDENETFASRRSSIPLAELLRELAAAARSDVSGTAAIEAVCDASAECMGELLRQYGKQQQRRQKEDTVGRRMHVLGLDIMLDATGRPWLLEANHCPCMRFKTRPNDKRLVVDMVKLALRMGLAESESLGLDELRWQPHMDMDGDRDASHAWRELRLDPPLPGGSGDESY